MKTTQSLVFVTIRETDHHCIYSHTWKYNGNLKYLIDSKKLVTNHCIKPLSNIAIKKPKFTPMPIPPWSRPKNKQLMSQAFHGWNARWSLAMDGLSSPLTFTSIDYLQDLAWCRWRWECPERGQRQPLFGCRRQRDNNANLKRRYLWLSDVFLKSDMSQKRTLMICDVWSQDLTHLFFQW